MKLIQPVNAHCDGPCGHYETDSLKHAGQTCLKLVQKLTKLGDTLSQDYVRLTMLKEEHAQIVKCQTYILWSDFFKAQHYDRFANLHQQLYNLVQQASLVKQTVDIQVVTDLIDQINSLDQIFQQIQNDLN